MADNQLEMIRRWIPLATFASFMVGPVACGSSDSGDEAAAGPTEAETSAAFEDRKAWAEEQGLQLKQFDLNRDDKPNVFKFFRLDDAGSEQIVRKDIDLNNDGRVDVIQLFGDDGRLKSEQSDLDFDGKMDVTAYFEEDVLIRKELDLDFDGTPDILRYYAEGKLDRIETDANGDGRVDTWEYFVEGELDRVGTDNDGDGVVDHWDRRRQRENGTEGGNAGEDSDPSSDDERATDDGDEA